MDNSGSIVRTDSHSSSRVQAAVLFWEIPQNKLIPGKIAILIRGLIWFAQLVVMAYTAFYVFYVCNKNFNWGKLEAYSGEVPQNQNTCLKKTLPGHGLLPKWLTSYTNEYVFYVILKWGKFEAYSGGNTQE
jgi:hypothetical protein